MSMSARSLRSLVPIVVLFAVYVVTARFGLWIDAVSGFATPVWPPTGISLVALSLFGYRLWPGIALGAFLVNRLAGAPLLAAGGMAAGNTLEAVLGTYLLQRAVGFRPPLDRLRDVIGLVAAAAVLSTTVSATIGVTSGWLGGVIPSIHSGQAWWTWWLGDMIGDLVIAPLLFVWIAQPRIRMTHRQAAEAGILLISVIGVSLLIFGSPLATRTISSPYLLFPLLIWAALRFGQHGAVTTIVAVSTVAIWGTVYGSGPFAGQSRHEDLLLLQTFVGVVAVTILVLAAVVSERKRLEEALRQRAEALARADRAKDQFLAMLAHELRNPLAPILHAIELLEQLGAPEPPLIRAREIIHRQVSHQAHLLDDLLNVSRIARGKIVLRCERLDLVPLIRSTVEDHRSLLEAAGLTLVLQLPESAVWVEGDPIRLAQVVGNLLQNAAKFTDPGGQVTVSLSLAGDGKDRTTETRRHGGINLSPQPPPRSGEGEPGSDAGPGEDRHPSPLRGGAGGEVNPPRIALLFVRDTGIGIEPEMLSQVFDLFAQADRTLDRSRGGLGLGLALVKGLVELHGGDVRAESEGLGRGATFTVRLPIRPAPPATARIAAPSNLSGGPIRILIVEDNRDTAETLRDLLELSGCTVAVAYSGAEGVEAARQLRPEVVLCDLGLPGMDGYQVAAALRQDPDLAGARLIAISGYGQEEDQLRAREAGFDLHLTKPVEFAELRRLLEVAPKPRSREL
jgi:signal transduction histidine kinase/ActR/RegA family two-component response regulator